MVLAIIRLASIEPQTSPPHLRADTLSNKLSESLIRVINSRGQNPQVDNSEGFPFPRGVAPLKIRAGLAGVEPPGGQTPSSAPASWVPSPPGRHTSRSTHRRHVSRIPRARERPGARWSKCASFLYLRCLYLRFQGLDFEKNIYQIVLKTSGDHLLG